jgi:hypothetical protein
MITALKVSSGAFVYPLFVSMADPEVSFLGIKEAFALIDQKAFSSTNKFAQSSIKKVDTKLRHVDEALYELRGMVRDCQNDVSAVIATQAASSHVTRTNELLQKSNAEVAAHEIILEYNKYLRESLVESNKEREDLRRRVHEQEVELQNQGLVRHIQYIYEVEYLLT